jgi:hypothetical protein
LKEIPLKLTLQKVEVEAAAAEAEVSLSHQNRINGLTLKNDMRELKSVLKIYLRSKIR